MIFPLILIILSVSQNIFDVDFLRNVNQINNQPISISLNIKYGKITDDLSFCIETIREFRRGIAS